jgi:murein DD-endopeptidase MepM/ murein hydrolase activator NlpD
VTARRTAALLVAFLGVLVFGTGAGAQTSSPSPAGASGYAVSISAPDGSSITGAGYVSAPPEAGTSGSFGYPGDGFVVSAGSESVSASADESTGRAYASAEFSGISIFGGEITVGSLRAAVSAGAAADFSDTSLTNLTVLGQSVQAPAPGLSMQLADWGTLSVLREDSSVADGTPPASHGSVSGLTVYLTADHGRLLRGSTIRIGYADASGHGPVAETTTTATTTTTPATTGTEPTTTETPTERTTPTNTVPTITLPPTLGRPKTTTEQGHETQPDVQPVQRQHNGLPVRTSIPDVTPKLTVGHYVFPVYGPSAYGDSFGAPRGDVSGGWHHGDDIFAPLGAPILAVADGTVFSVGWNDVGGWRLWLRDTAGNEFYYAHLSAYTSLAVDGRRVHAGDVLGFVGNTGDAATTPFHLHFEVHPVSLLFLGYDGAVNPTKYLDAWKRLEDVRIRAAVPFSLLPAAAATNAPTPGAILIGSSDISTANGLDPDSLRRAMNTTNLIEEAPKPTVGDLPVPLPVLDRA